MDVLTLDFETYWDTDYTLSKLSTSGYIRDELFYAHGCGIKWGNDDSLWLTDTDLTDVLEEIDWKNTLTICHNAYFDNFILSHHYGIVPAFICDTMSMSKGRYDNTKSHSLNGLAHRLKLGKKIEGTLESTKGVKRLSETHLAKLGVYCLQDVELTYKAFILMAVHYPKAELDLIDLSIRMFVDPVLQVDKQRVREELIQEKYAQHRALEDTCEQLGIKDKETVRQILASNQKFSALLEDFDVDVPFKEGKNGQIPALAKNDREFQQLIDDSEGIVHDLLQARLIVKSRITETRAERMLSHADPALPIYLGYCSAHTMRYGGGDKFNPQNLPSGRNGRSTRLRRSITAPHGQVIVVVDSSQIEDRLNCWMSGQNDILAIYSNNKDAYARTAEKIYRLPKDSLNKSDPERNMGKVARLGLGFGAGIKTFKLIIQTGAFGPPIKDFSEAEAKRIVYGYRNENSAIVDFWAYCGDCLDAMFDGGEIDYTPDNHNGDPVLHFHSEGIIMPNGLTLHYPDLIDKKGEITYAFNAKTRARLWPSKMVENIIQCLARIVICEQMVKINEHYRVVSMIHDEVLFLAPKKDAEKAYEFGVDIMSRPPKWCASLPLAAEGGWAKNYSK